MKSLFSCFPQKRNKKLKKTKKSIEPDAIIETKPVTETLNVEQTEKLTQAENVSTMSLKSVDVSLGGDEKDKELQKRLAAAMARIDNVSWVLEGRRKGYCLATVQSELAAVQRCEMAFLQMEAELIPRFRDRVDALAEMADIQMDVLQMIATEDFVGLSTKEDRFRDLSELLNTGCGRDQDDCAVMRLLADSTAVFGWLCLERKPAEFVSGTLDGCAVVAAAMTASLGSAVRSLLRRWMAAVAALVSIVQRHFKVALMWHRPRSQRFLQIILETNYAVHTHPLPRPAQPKVVSTKKVDDVSYEDMGGLMADLRSGKQRSRLRKVIQAAVGPSGDGEGGVPINGEDGVRNNGEGGVQLNREDGMWINGAEKGKLHVLDNERNQEELSVRCNSGETVRVQNCHNCAVHVEGDADTVFLVDCSDIRLLLEDVIGNGLIFSCCTNIETQILGSASLVRVSASSSLQLFMSSAAASAPEFSLITDKGSCNTQLLISRTEDGGLELEDYDCHLIGEACISRLSMDLFSLVSTVISRPKDQSLNS